MSTFFEFIRFGILFMLIFVSCSSDWRTLDKVQIDNKTFYLERDSPHATVAYSFRVIYEINEKSHLLFESYALPTIDSISIRDEDLILYDSDLSRMDSIKIKLSNLESFIKIPVRYYSLELIQTNDDYTEPMYIKILRDR